MQFVESFEIISEKQSLLPSILGHHDESVFQHLSLFYFRITLWGKYGHHPFFQLANCIVLGQTFGPREMTGPGSESTSSHSRPMCLFTMFHWAPSAHLFFSLDTFLDIAKRTHLSFPNFKLYCNNPFRCIYKNL